jgi:hypothetical protein
MLPADIARCDGYVPIGTDRVLDICWDCRRREPGADELTIVFTPLLFRNPVNGSRICAQRIGPKG